MDGRRRRPRSVSLDGVEAFDAIRNHGAIRVAAIRNLSERPLIGHGEPLHGESPMIATRQGVVTSSVLARGKPRELFSIVGG